MSHAPPESSSASVSRSTRLLVGLLFGALALEGVVLRLLEFSVLRTYELTPVAEVAWGALPVVLPLALVPAGVYVALGTKRLRGVIDSRLRMTVAAGVAAALAVVAAHLVPQNWAAALWLNLRAFAWVRWDLLVVLAGAAGFALLLEFANGWRRSVVVAVMHAVVLALIALMAASFLHMLALGAPGGWHDFKFLALSTRDLLPVVASEATAGRIALLLLPLAALALPLLLVRGLAAGRGENEAAARPLATGEGRAAVTLRVAAVVLPLAALLCLPPGRWLPFQPSQSFYGGLASDAASDLVANPVPGAAAASLGPAATGGHGGHTPGFFDTDSLRLAPAAGDSLAQTKKRPRNVVFVVLESVRRRSTTPYDSTLATTPFLDSLAARSLLVEDMTAVVPHTDKSMTPLFAGTYPRPSYDVAEAEPGGLPAKGLPAMLRERGYATGFFDAATTGYQNKEQALRNLGFSHVADYRDFPQEGFEKINYFGYEDRIVTQPSLAWADSVRSAGSPFFAAHLNVATHHPYKTPESFEKKTYAEDERLNKYLNAVRYTDGWLRDLFAAYERRGLLDSTLFVVVGDHGQAFGEHGLFTHGAVIWEEALEVPALLYSPGLFPNGRTVEGARQQIDLMPTIAELLGYDLRGGTYPGRSLLTAPDSSRALYHMTGIPSQHLAMRQGGLKFIYNYGRAPMQVFDLAEDPRERNDRASHHSEAELRAAKRRMLRWRQQVEQVYEQHQPAGD